MSLPEDHGPEDGGDRTPFSLPGMLLKLILLPGMVVLLLVLVFMIMGWMTASPSDVDSLVESLNEGGRSRWRAAVGLAGILQEPGRAALKSDPTLAARLIEILHRELEAGGLHDEQITLRMYLCRALGEFHIADPLPVLVKAAATERDPAEADVRRSAIEAMAVLASNVGPPKLRSNAEVISVLLEASDDPRPAVRSAAAFALGVIGGTEAEGRLEAMLSDGYPDVRYNAATGLARHGNPKAVEVLLEMLDPSQSAGIDVEKQEPAKDFKRAMIVANGLRAVRQLAGANRTADLGRLSGAVERLARAEVPEGIRIEATEVLSELREGSSASDASTEAVAP